MGSLSDFDLHCDNGLEKQQFSAENKAAFLPNATATCILYLDEQNI